MSQAIGPIMGENHPVPVYKATISSWHKAEQEVEPLWHKTKRVGWDILRGFVVFWVLAQILRPVIRACILPASWMRNSGSAQNFAQHLDRFGLNVVEFFVKTSDGAQIHCAMARRKDRPQSDKPYSNMILVHNPNGVSFTRYASDALHPLVALSRENLPNDTALVFFDHRSVGHSKGSFNHCEDLIIDSLSVHQVLREEFEIKPTDINCYGHSLGAAVAAVAMDRERSVASHRRLFSDRSFTSLDAVIKGIAGRILGAFGCYLLSLSGFGTLDPANDLEGLGLDAFYATGHLKDRVIRPGAQIREFTPPNVARGCYRIRLPDIASDDYHNEPLLNFGSPRVQAELRHFMTRSDAILA